MANLNKVMLIGRLTRDPEVRTFASGGKVASFGFAVNNKKKNAQTGQWEDVPVFLDVEAFNRGEQGRRLADVVEQYMRKGHQFFLEGHLRLDQWTSQDGQKREKLRIVLDNFEFLEPRAEGGMSEGGMPAARGAPAPRRMASPQPVANEFDEPGQEPDAFAPPARRGEEEIPF